MQYNPILHWPWAHFFFTWGVYVHVHCINTLFPNLGIFITCIFLQPEMRTPLMIACLKQKTDFAKKLVKKKADILAMDGVRQ